MIDPRLPVGHKVVVTGDEFSTGESGEYRGVVPEAIYPILVVLNGRNNPDAFYASELVPVAHD